MMGQKKNDDTEIERISLLFFFKPSASNLLLRSLQSNYQIL